MSSEKQNSKHNTDRYRLPCQSCRNLRIVVALQRKLFAAEELSLGGGIGNVGADRSSGLAVSPFGFFAGVLVGVIHR